MRLATPLFALLLFALPARAQTPGTCTLGQAQAQLDVSDVAATLFNTGSLFFGNQTADGDGYAVPRYSNRPSIFAAGLWVGGRVGGQVRVAAARYTNFNFWPGPLDATGRPVNPASCAAYDRIYTVSVNDVTAYTQTGTATADLAQWPVGLGAGAVTAAGQPVVPTSLAQTIDLAAGERPVIYGSQTAFWVMNDVGNVHAGTNTPPIGLEVRVHAFAIDSPELDLARGTFYRYELVYRGAVPFEEARLSLFTDPDLGNAVDDYIGTDVARGMAFTYNGDEDDEGPVGYGVAPPAIGFDLLRGAGSSSYFINGGSFATTDPTTGVQTYNFQQGLWGDGTEVRTFGTGYQQTQGAVTTFAFPGDPVTNQPWSEGNNGTGVPTMPGDRRLVVSTPAFTLQPGESRRFDVAILYGRGDSRLASITALRAASDRVQALHNDNSLYAPGLGGQPGTAPGAISLVAPSDGAFLGVESAVRLDWTPAQGATGYVVEVARDAAFSVGVQRFGSDVDTLAFRPEPNVRQAYYWRVQAFNRSVGGPLSGARSFTVYGPYQGIVEGVQEWDAAGPVATNADGSATDPSLLNSLNSTRTRPPTFLVSAQGVPSNDPAAVIGRLNFNNYLTDNGPREYEIRWVDPAQGQVILNRAWDRTTPGRAFLTCLETGTAVSTTAPPANVVTTPAPVVGGYPRMPFQLWEIDPDGTERQVHINVLDDDADLCYSFTTAANSGAAPLGSFGYERIYGSRVPYIESELTNPAEVHARANVASAEAQAFGRLTIIPIEGPARPPQAGTRIRIVTTDDYTTATEAPPAGTVELALEAARPNPVRSRATVRFTTAAAGTVRLTLVDVLGRQVAVLAQGERAAGAHEATLDAGRLASGVYLLVLESGGSRAVRPVTVVR